MSTEPIVIMVMRRLCDREVEARIRLDAELPRPDAVPQLVIGKLDAGKIVSSHGSTARAARAPCKSRPELGAPLNISGGCPSWPEAEHRIKPGRGASDPRTFLRGTTSPDASATAPELRVPPAARHRSDVRLAL